MKFEEDLDLFTSGEFSTVALINGDGAKTISGIFDENYQDGFGGFDAPTTEGRKYCFQTQSEAVSYLNRGDRLNIYGKNYRAVSFQPVFDGRLTNIVLKQDY